MGRVAERFQITQGEGVGEEFKKVFCGMYSVYILRGNFCKKLILRECGWTGTVLEANWVYNACTPGVFFLIVCMMHEKKHAPKDVK